MCPIFPGDEERGSLTLHGEAPIQIIALFTSSGASVFCLPADQAHEVSLLLVNTCDRLRLRTGLVGTLTLEKGPTREVQIVESYTHLDCQAVCRPLGCAFSAAL